MRNRPYLEVAEVDRNERPSSPRDGIIERAFSAGRVGTWEWEIATNTIHCSQSVATILGLAQLPEDKSLESFLRFVHPDDCAEVQAVVARALTNSLHQAMFQISFRIVHPNGDVRWLDDVGTVYGDSDGAPERMSGVIIDVTDRQEARFATARLHEELEQRVAARTAELSQINQRLECEIEERKRTEIALRQSEERVAKAFRSSPDGIVISRLSDGVFLEVNPSWERIAGYTAAEAIGKTSLELGMYVNLADRPRLIAQFMRDGFLRDVEVKIRRKSGEIRDAMSSTELIEVGGETCMLSIVRDVTERNQTERAVREGERRLRLALWATSVGIWEWHLESNTIEWSEETMRIFGISPAEFCSNYESFHERIHPDDRKKIVEQLRDLVASSAEERSYHAEHRIVLPSGEARWVESKGLVIRDPDGLRRRMLGTIADITDRKRAEQAIQSQQAELAHFARLSTMGELATGIAHELNQPLCAISNFALGCNRRLQSGKFQAPELQSALQQIADQAARAAEIIRRLRRFVSKQTPQRSIVDLNALIREVIQLVAREIREREITVTLELIDTSSVVQADSIQIQQVVLNLIRNAYEAMQTTAPPRRLTIKTDPAVSTMVQVSVRDNGPGIACGDLERVFDSFYSTKREGLGVGLSISRTIIESHEGQLWAVPGIENGAEFCFTLPVAAEEYTRDA